MTTHQDLFFQEFLSPIYKKYEDDSEFIVETEDGEKMYNVQYALLKESEFFEPHFWECEDGVTKVVGFHIRNKPGYFLQDGRYTSEPGLLISLMLDFNKHYQETGEQVAVIAYVGFGDAVRVCGE